MEYSDWKESKRFLASGDGHTVTIIDYFRVAKWGDEGYTARKGQHCYKTIDGDPVERVGESDEYKIPALGNLVVKWIAWTSK